MALLRRAQMRFYTELENWLSSVTDLSSEGRLAAGDGSEGVREHLDQLTRKLQGQGGSGRVTEALGNLVDSIQQMVRHMRSEQEITRQQLERQEAQQQEILLLMRRMNMFFDKASKE